MGALQIQIGTFHRSVSCDEGSMVLNESRRDSDFNSRTEFIPVRLLDRTDLQQSNSTEPWIWSWTDGHICREHHHQ